MLHSGEPFFIMAKDPAFLFYPNDWVGGTMGMTFEEKGAYMELLMMQFNRGHMTSHMVGQVVGQIWDKINHKFIQDDEGKWYNERLDIEIMKRKNFTKSRRNNLLGINQYKKNKEKNITHMNGHMTSHMENVNENENVIVNNINKVNIENEDLWNTQKNLFLNDFRWNEKFCRDKNVLKIVFDKKILDFVNEIELRNEWKDKKELQRHFVNWFKKNNNNGKSVSEQRMDAAYEYANRYAPKGTAGKAD